MSWRRERRQKKVKNNTLSGHHTEKEKRYYWGKEERRTENYNINREGKKGAEEKQASFVLQLRRITEQEPASSIRLQELSLLSKIPT